MSHIGSQHSQRKTFLSPQYIRSIKTIQSPKFDQQKADQDHLKRKILYEQKLAKYDQYNSILSAKVNKEISSLNSCNHHTKTQPKTTKNALSKPHMIPKTNQHTESRIITCSQPQQQKRKYLNEIRQRNHNLHSRNAQLKTYLNQINLGVSELDCILQEVEDTFNSLNQIHPPQFNGLWFLNQQEEDDDHLKSQKHTKDTVDMDYDRTGTFRNLSVLNQSISPGNKNLVHRQNNQPGARIQSIDALEQKFQQILQKITKRQMFQMKIDCEISELNALEKQIDQLRQKNNTNKQLTSSKSQKNLPLILQNPQNSLPNPTLNKVKSLGRIIS